MQFRTAMSVPPRRALRTAAMGLCVVMLAIGGAVPLLAQTRSQQEGRPADTIWATPRGRYDAGALHRFLLSSGYRDLWSTPIRVEVLDLDRFAGGLTVDRAGGGLQTRSLRMKGQDGRVYAFRSIDKDASRTLAEDLRNSVAARVLQDQIGSLLPVSALVVAPLLDAAGVLQADPRLVVMPDDPRLGEYRSEFAGMLGFIEERPNEGDDEEPGFAGAERITGSPRFLERLDESSRNRIDDAAYLRARLIDAFVGDFDRHPDQWRWAAFDEGSVTVWRPIPRDRDWALARIDGLLPRIMAFGYPQYVGFSEQYPSAFRLTWSARALDRRMLSGLPRASWNAVVTDLQRRLSDAVIANAVRRMPQPYHERIGVELEAALRARRDRLPQFADDYYRLLAGWVDVHATQDRELVEIVRLDSARVRIEISAASRGAGDAPYFRRVFDARETKEVRIHLKAGDDHAAVIGETRGGPRIRVIGGDGDDTLIDRTASGSRVHFYDHSGRNRFERARHTTVDERPYEQPDDPTSRTAQAKARDWGTLWTPVPVLGYDPDLGLYVGGGANRYAYGFRQFPYASKLSFTLGFGTSTGRVRAGLRYDFPVIGRSVRGLLEARWSGAELDRFYGFGNETSSERSHAFYEAQRREFGVETHLSGRLREIQLSAGPSFTSVRPFDNTGTLVDSVAPYGYGDFNELGVSGRLLWDRRDRPRGATRGGYVLLRSRLVPAWLDVEEMFASTGGEAAVFLSPGMPLRPTLALRAGGEKLWGEYPYFDAAYLGGRGTVRGFPNRRFAGDASLFTNTELRLTFARHAVLIPGQLGVLGLADVGRVFVEGEDSGSWHSAVGGGFWMSFRNTSNALNVTVARSAERTSLYVGAGFAF